jgi:hypothetical protein
MSAANSVVSNTDLAVFYNLANPSKVDITSQNKPVMSKEHFELPPTTINGEEGPAAASPPREDRRSDSRHRESARRRRSGSSHKRSRSRRHHRRHGSRHHRRESRHELSAERQAPDVSRSDNNNISLPKRPRTPPPPPSPSHARRSWSRPPSVEPDRREADRRPTDQPAEPRVSFGHNFNPFAVDPFHVTAYYPDPGNSGRLDERAPPAPPAETNVHVSRIDQETQRYMTHRPEDASVAEAVGSPPEHRRSPHHSTHHHHHSSDERRHSPRRSSRERRHSPRHHRLSRSAEPNYYSASEEYENIEKRKYLIIIQKMIMQGIHFTRKYTMEDSLADIKYEVDSHQSNLDVVETVKWMKDILVLGFYGVETSNYFLGSYLHINGWAKYMQDNIFRFDRVLERIYHRYWRQGQPSIVAEVAMLIVGNLVIFHVQNKYFGGLRIGEMMNIMPGGSAPPPSPPQAAAAATQQQGPGIGNLLSTLMGGVSGGGGGGAGGGGGGGLGGLGNLLSLFTGRGNVNQPSAPPQQPARPAQSQPPQSQPPQSHVPLSNITNTVPREGGRPEQYQSIPSVPITSSPVPATATVAVLPTMAIKGVTNGGPEAHPPTRRVLRRPSAHLTTADGIGGVPLPR